MMLVAAYLLPLVAGFCLASRLVPEIPVLGRLGVGWLLGAGLGSLLAFGWLVAGGALDRTYAVCDAAAFLTLALVFRPRAMALRRPSAAEWAMAATLAVAVALMTAHWISWTSANPHGAWDATGIWNLRARFLFRLGGDWRGAFAPELGYSHTEYPLLLPLGVARAWAYAGESTLAPAVLAWCFTLAVPAVLAGIGGPRGAVAALLSLATPAIAEGGLTQYADVPLAALLVAAVSLLAPRPLALASCGFLLGLAGWTKNEGLAAAVVAFAVAALAFRRLAMWLAAGALVPALAWAVFHVSVAPALAPALAQSPASVLASLADLARWRVVMAHLALDVPGLALGIPAVALVAALLLEVRPRWPVVAVVATWYLGIVFMFMVIPRVDWHLGTAARRVMAQPWPALLFALFAPRARPSPALPEERPESPA